MCGILGLLTPRRSIEVSKARKALDTLSHRGPDGMGILLASSKTLSIIDVKGERAIPTDCDCDLFLGHRRLSIIDLSETAAQPMCNEDQAVWTTFNGEIYNHEDLRSQLLALGHIFKTDHSDTEVLVHGWEQWGEGLLSKLNGMFAFAILDLRKRIVFLARDRFGEKPLYYATNVCGISFASELKALMVLDGTEKEISEKAI